MTGYSVTVQDAEWTDGDLRAAIEWQSEQDMLCDCGRPHDESMREDADYNARPVRCHACEALGTAARARAGVEEEDPDAGIKWRLEQGRPDGDID